MTTTQHSVSPGVAYPVESVAGRDATLLAQFMGETSFTVDVSGTPCIVRGWGSPLDERVRFEEKDEVLGKDVRVWLVTETDGGFAAEHVGSS
jgi:hypothetical protein